jgi:serine/threonine-protein kinase HipA
MVDVAEVHIWGDLVGAVRWDVSQQLASFQYADAFLRKGIELSPIKMPTQTGNRIHKFPELRSNRPDEPSTFRGLPGLLADVLPDKYGNQLINIWLAQNGRPPNDMNPVEQLSFIGARGMGALEFEPTQLKATKRPFDIEIASLADAAQKILAVRDGFETNLQDDEHKAMVDILKVGTSAGGARPKAVIAYNQKTGMVKSGQTKAPKGFEHWMIKLDGVSDAQFGATHGFGRVEMAYYYMAVDCGIRMMDCELLEDGDRAHFMTKRFDREGHDTKHHVQTFCAMQHFDYNHIMAYSYEQLFQTMRILKLSYPDAEEMFRRMAFNVMATNYDDHTKNFGFMLKQGGDWELSPAYDVCYSYDPTNVWVSQHTMSINGKHKDITREDLLAIAKANSIKKANRIIDRVSDVVADWERYSKKVHVDKRLSTSIKSTHLRMY